MSSKTCTAHSSLASSSTWTGLGAIRVYPNNVILPLPDTRATATAWIGQISCGPWSVLKTHRGFEGKPFLSLVGLVSSRDSPHPVETYAVQGSYCDVFRNRACLPSLFLSFPGRRRQLTNPRGSPRRGQERGRLDDAAVIC